MLYGTLNLFGFIINTVAENWSVDEEDRDKGVETGEPSKMSVGVTSLPPRHLQIIYEQKQLRVIINSDTSSLPLSRS